MSMYCSESPASTYDDLVGQETALKESDIRKLYLSIDQHLLKEYKDPNSGEIYVYLNPDQSNNQELINSLTENNLILNNILLTNNMSAILVGMNMNTEELVIVKRFTDSSVGLKMGDLTSKYFAKYQTVPISHGYETESTIHYVHIYYIYEGSLEGATLSPLDILNFVYQSTQGISAWHGRGYAIRDVSPFNFLRDRSEFLMNDIEFSSSTDDFSTIVGVSIFIDYRSVIYRTDNGLKDSDMYSLALITLYLMLPGDNFEKSSLIAGALGLQSITEIYVNFNNVSNHDISLKPKILKDPETNFYFYNGNLRPEIVKVIESAINRKYQTMNNFFEDLLIAFAQIEDKLTK